jgi:N-acetylmuramoyl-L-alanine amidase
MREINLIVIHCSATRADRDVTAQDINAAHKVRGFSSWGYHFYIRKSGRVETMRPLDEVGAHARGYNAKSIGICYEGGLDTNGKPADTRTMSQQIALHSLASRLLKEFPGSRVVGHRDLSPDKNYNGIIDPWERVKECPCFSVLEEVWE